jgi:hypothetical protein
MDEVCRYLIVTDHELDQDQLAAKVQHAMAAGPCRFYVLVLAIPPGSSYNFWGLIAGGEAVPPPTSARTRTEPGSGPATSSPTS